MPQAERLAPAARILQSELVDAIQDAIDGDNTAFTAIAASVTQSRLSTSVIQINQSDGTRYTLEVR